MIHSTSLRQKNNIQKTTTNLRWKQVLSHKYFYIMLIPFIVYYIVFRYLPMYGIILAFKEFEFNKSILASQWVGLKWFKDIFYDIEFWRVFKNTLVICLGRLVTGFPAPIVLALMLNEIRKNRTKRVLQTIYTFPHYLSWIVVVGVLYEVLSSDGLLNQLIMVLGGQQVSFLMNPDIFRPLLYITDIWKEVGWNTIIYLAALSTVSPELYESSFIDGANRFQQLIYITWPGIVSTMTILLILNVGNLINNGNFDQVINMYNPGVYDVSDILDTYLYRISFQKGVNFGFSTAVGLFKSVISLVMLLSVDRIARAMGQEGIY